jgi:hypothetical protein
MPADTNPARSAAPTSTNACRYKLPGVQLQQKELGIRYYHWDIMNIIMIVM